MTSFPFFTYLFRYYKRSKKTHRLENVDYVDNSYKWSGGGFLSTVDDLIVFGNEMLTCSSTNQGMNEYSIALADTVIEKPNIEKCSYVVVKFNFKSFFIHIIIFY